MVSAILWDWSARRAASHFRFHQRLGQRTNYLAQEIAMTRSRIRETGVARRFQIFRMHQSDTEVGEARMVVWPAPQRPVEFALLLSDRMFVNAGEAPGHQTISIELPVLVAIGPEPVAAVVAVFVGEARSDPVASERPQLVAQPIVQFVRPFAREKGFYGHAS